MCYTLSRVVLFACYTLSRVVFSRCLSGVLYLSWVVSLDELSHSVFFLISIILFLVWHKTLAVVVVFE